MGQPPKVPVSSGKLKKGFEHRRWLNAKELAEYIGSTPGGVRALVYRDQISAYKPFGKLLFDKNEIDRKVEASRLLAWYEKNLD